MSTARVVTFALAATFVLLALDKSGQLRGPPLQMPAPSTTQAPKQPAAQAVASRGTPGVTPRALPADVTHQDTVDSLPPGKGQEETFYTCAACHGTALIKAQGMSREMWDQSFQLMIDRHSMAEPDKADRAMIVDYLAASFPPRRRGRGGDNPFLKN
jgi:hypothetical protein